MRLLDTKTRYFDRDTFQIPQIGNTWGCIVDFLDVTLVHGTGYQDVLSIRFREDVKYPELYWLADLDVPVGHGFKENLSVVEISNCVNNTYNGVFRVQEVTVDSITIAFRKSTQIEQPPDVVNPTGTTIRQPSLGFEKTYEEAQKAVYKVTTTEGKVCYLRVDNTCPAGHNPAHAKFARVSMFENMDHIDDYKYRKDRKKCPMYVGDENRVEEGVYQTWFSTRYNSSYLHSRTPTNVSTNDFICLVGDSEMFYWYIYDIRPNNDVNRRDEIYAFGSYLKYVYKEDPLPFILRCSKAQSKGSFEFIHYSQNSSITRNKNWCNNTFSVEPEGMYFSNNSDSFALLAEDLFSSGFYTGVNYKPYKNELSLHIANMDLKFYRPGNTVLEGRYWGLKVILNNLQNSRDLEPALNKVFNKGSEYYLFLRMFDTSNQDQRLLIQLTDWR